MPRSLSRSYRFRARFRGADGSAEERDERAERAQRLVSARQIQAATAQRRTAVLLCAGRAARARALRCERDARAALRCFRHVTVRPPRHVIIFSSLSSFAFCDDMPIIIIDTIFMPATPISAAGVIFMPARLPAAIFVFAAISPPAITLFHYDACCLSPPPIFLLTLTSAMPRCHRCHA